MLFVSEQSLADLADLLAPCEEVEIPDAVLLAGAFSVGEPVIAVVEEAL